MPLTVPSPSEPLLANVGTTGRLAYVIDCLLNIIGGAGASGYTPVALLVSTVAVGGTPVSVAVGPVSGGYVTNPLTEVENMYIDMVGAPGSTDAAAAGTTTTILVPGQSFTIPPLATGVNVKVNAATNGHKITGEKW